MVDFYSVLKALHIVAVMSWMAGLLYLPRIFVYLSGVAPGSAESGILEVMARRLRRVIMTPAMVASWVLGLVLVWWGGFWLQPWFWLKLVLVVALSALHMFFVSCERRFGGGERPFSARFFRMMNEAPAALMVFVVLVAVLAL